MESDLTQRAREGVVAAVMFFGIVIRIERFADRSVMSRNWIACVGSQLRWRMDVSLSDEALQRACEQAEDHRGRPQPRLDSQ